VGASGEDDLAGVMIRSVLIGFDSAWADNPKAPGAICAMVANDDTQEFIQLKLVGFDAAADFVREVTQSADYVLIAIDQPLIVPNLQGGRPCERVAGSLIGKLGGGVQPARRCGGGSRFFGDAAPIWRFLRAIEADLNPFEARCAKTGRFAVEVFPALALPTLQPEILHRARAAKYNPANRSKFSIEDWRLVCSGVENGAAVLGLLSLAEWAAAMRDLDHPRKADQDRLDAAICLLVAAGWRQGGLGDPLVIGCGQFGYIASLASPEVMSVIASAGQAKTVQINVAW